MSKKNVFVSNEKKIEIAKGKIDLSKATPEFKEKAIMYAYGINAINNERLNYAKKVSALRNALEVYQKETYTNSVRIDELTADIANAEKAYNDINTELRNAQPEFDKVDKNLFYAYRQYTNGEIEHSVYVRAFAEWLDNAGIIPTDKGIVYFTTKIGENKASAMTMFKNNGTKFTGAKSEKVYLDLVYRLVANLMQEKGLLKQFTYTYVAPEKTKNN